MDLRKFPDKVVFKELFQFSSHLFIRHSFIYYSSIYIFIFPSYSLIIHHYYVILYCHSILSLFIISSFSFPIGSFIITFIYDSFVVLPKSSSIIFNDYFSYYSSSVSSLLLHSIYSLIRPILHIYFFIISFIHLLINPFFSIYLYFFHIHY